MTLRGEERCDKERHPEQPEADVDGQAKGAQGKAGHRADQQNFLERHAVKGMSKLMSAREPELDYVSHAYRAHH